MLFGVVGGDAKATYNVCALPFLDVPLRATVEGSGRRMDGAYWAGNDDAAEGGRVAAAEGRVKRQAAVDAASRLPASVAGTTDAEINPPSDVKERITEIRETERTRGEGNARPLRINDLVVAFWPEKVAEQGRDTEEEA
jgi:hypothetical protein